MSVRVTSSQAGKPQPRPVPIPPVPRDVDDLIFRWETDLVPVSDR